MAKRKVLITGVAGFVGSHLAEYLTVRFPETIVHGTCRPKGSTDNIRHILDKIELHEADITDVKSTHRVVDTIRPEVIFHLAAQSYVRTSWESPEATLSTNIIGQANLLEAVRSMANENYSPTIIVVGTSEEYGYVNKDEPILKEDAPLRPLSPYAVSKIGQDFLGYQYHQTYGLNIVRLRAFNHTGPRRPTAFGDSRLAHAIAMIERGISEPVVMYRDLTAVRDFTDVRDVVRAYVLASERCTAGEVYNVCSGRGVSIQQIYDVLLACSKVRDIELVPDPSGPRPTDGGVVVGDNSKIKHAADWEPEISFPEKTLPDLLNYWREQVSA